MKKKVLSTILSAAMVATLLVGCGGQAASTTTSEPAPAKTEEAAAPAASTETTEAGGELNFKIVVKSFQSSYWQAAVTGVNQAAEELGVKVECNGPNAESDIADSGAVRQD